MSAGGQDMPGGKTRAQWQQQAKEIERLTAESKADKIRLADMEATCEFLHETEADNERLQAKVEALDKVRVAVLKHRDNKKFLNIDTWNACVYAAEAATEQGENRYDATKE